MPRLRHAAKDEEGGRGLDLAGIISDAWGVKPVQDEYGTGNR